MIVKNEEEYIERCLESVKDIVDEIVIVDTGSSDKTVEMAKAYGASVYHFSWNNHFGDARNASLDKASGDWILILDADEKLHQEDQQTVKEVLHNDKADAYYLRIHSYLSQKETDKLIDARLSLFRNNKNYRFKGAIHEEIASSIIAHGKYGNEGIISTDIRILHYGYLEQTIQKKQKKKRNKEIISQELSRDKNNPFLQYALAVEYLQENNFKQAKSLLLTLLQKWNSKHFLYSDALYKLCISLKELKDYTSCLTWLKKGIQLFPDYTDLHYVKGAVELEQGNWNTAVSSFLTCISLGSTPDKYFSFDGVGTYRAWYALGMVYEAVNQTEQAINAYLMSLKHNSQFTDALFQLIQFSLRKLEKEQFLDLLQEHIHLTHPESFYAIGQILITLHRFDYFIYLTNRIKETEFTEKHYFYHMKICERIAQAMIKEKHARRRG